jgi:hypothetical protein
MSAGALGKSGVSSRDIESFHRKIVPEVHSVCGIRITVTPRAGHKNWRNAIAPSRIEFELMLKDERWVPELVQRDRGGRTPVIQIWNDDPTHESVWAGWYEVWDKIATDKYILVGVSWSFYWGISGRPKTMMLRAEWDAIDTRSRVAAQPHWHVDTEFMLPTFRILVPASQPAEIPTTPDQALNEILTEQTEDLVEITDPTSIHDVSLSRIHLGMGLWLNGVQKADCWRHVIPENDQWERLVRWAKRTLEYAKDQFSEYPIRATQI